MPEITTTLRIPNYASNPASPLQGQMYINTTDKLTYYYSGTAWTALAASGTGVLSAVGTAPISVSPTTGAAVVSLDSAKVTNWDLAFTQTRQWDGGATGLTAANGRVNLGATIAGSSIFTLANPSSYPSFLKVDTGNIASYETAATFKTSLSLNNVTNDAQIKASDFPAASVDNEVALFTGISGKLIKRASTTGLAKLATGVLSTVTAPAGVVVGDTDTQTLTNKRITPRVLSTAAPGATPTLNTDNYDVVDYTGMTAAITSMTTNLTGSPSNFDKLTFRLKDNGTARAIAWGAKFVNHTGVLPLTTIAGKTTTVQLLQDSFKAQWMCVNTTVEGGGFAVLQTAAQSPAGFTTTTPGIMLGLGGGASPAVITPTASGKLFVTAVGYFSQNTAGQNIVAIFRFGTGTAPAYNAAGTAGTIFGAAVALGFTGVGPPITTPFALTGVLTGQTIGVQLWFDLESYVSGGTGTLSSLTINAIELP